MVYRGLGIFEEEVAIYRPPFEEIRVEWDSEAGEFLGATKTEPKSNQRAKNYLMPQSLLSTKNQ
jgi:hypothetical protein